MYLREDSYAKDIEDARKYLDKIKISGYYGGMDKAHIYFEFYKNDKKKECVVISHGFCENLIKYTEVIMYFYKKGYSVYALEHRGMARSTHLGKDETQVHVESFDHYVYDMKRFVDDVVKKEAPDNTLFLFAHSLGGLIGTRYAQMYPEDFKKIVLSSPFYGVEMKVPDKLLKVGTSVLLKAGKSLDYVLVHKEYDKFPDFEEVHTTSKARYDYNKRTHENEKQFRMMGGSYKWFYECMLAAEEVFKKENIANLDMDILLVSCGNDTLVDISCHKRFSNLLMNCRLFEISNSKHEAYIENDEILRKFYRIVFDFLEK